MSRPLPKTSPGYGLFLNTEQMRVYCGNISEATLNKWIECGFLPENRQEVPSGHKYWYRPEVDEWVARQLNMQNNGKGRTIGTRYRESR